MFVVALTSFVVVTYEPSTTFSVIEPVLVAVRTIAAGGGQLPDHHLYNGPVGEDLLIPEEESRPHVGTYTNMRALRQALPRQADAVSLRRTHKLPQPTHASANEIQLSCIAAAADASGTRRALVFPHANVRSPAQSRLLPHNARQSAKAE